MIYVTGDMHGDINRFSDTFLPNESEWSENDYLIICGDFGFIFFDDEREKKQLDLLEKKPYTILWVDGNHECFPAIFKYPVEIWNGGKTHKIRKNIRHLMRGQCFTIEGKKFFTMGGAYSIDRAFREKNVSYWDAEIPNNEEYKEASDTIFANDKKFDYIISHTAPKEIIWRLGYYPDPHDAELAGYLEWIMYYSEFKKWFFGHFHEDETLLDGKFRALYYDVERID